MNRLLGIALFATLCVSIVAAQLMHADPATLPTLASAPQEKASGRGVRRQREVDRAHVRILELGKSLRHRRR